MKQKFETTSDTIKLGYVSINGVTNIIDQELYLIEQDTYGTDDIGGLSADTDWEISEFDGEKITIKFKHKLWHMTVDEEDIGNKVYNGELIINIFTKNNKLNILDSGFE